MSTSKVEFGSLLTYAPRGITDKAKMAKMIIMTRMLRDDPEGFDKIYHQRSLVETAF